MDINTLIPKDAQGFANMGLILILAGIAILSAIGVVAFNTPIRSALSLVVNFFTLAFIYFTLGAEMMGITQIIVYTGAIMVLFLFVIMLLNLSSNDLLKHKKDGKPVLAIVFAMGLFGLISSQLLLPMMTITRISAPDRNPTDIGWGTPQAIGKTLFTSYVWPFEVVSLLLLVGIVGAILLARRKVPN